MPDVLVAGGGPAGAVTALRLRRLGFEVRLAEAASHGRPHVGEAISIGLQRQLHFLGLSETLLEAGFRPFDWCEEAWAAPTFQGRRSPPGSATVDRRRFDQALLSRCRPAAWSENLSG